MTERLHEDVVSRSTCSEKVKEAFYEIKEEIKGAVVYLDAAAAEIVQWSLGGLELFFALGACSVMILSPPTSTSW